MDVAVEMMILIRPDDDHCSCRQLGDVEPLAQLFVFGSAAATVDESEGPSDNPAEAAKAGRSMAESEDRRRVIDRN